jgi:hypothetical protein
MQLYHPYLLDLIEQEQAAIYRRARLEAQVRAARREERLTARKTGRGWRLIVPVLLLTPSAFNH